MCTDKRSSNNYFDLKKKLFYLIHNSSNGLTLDRLISLLGISEKKVKELIDLLEEEAMIYSDEKVYFSFFNQEHQKQQEVKVEKKWEKTKAARIKEIIRKIGKERLAILIEEKKKDLKGLISDDGAIFLIYKELGLDPSSFMSNLNRRKEQMFYGNNLYSTWVKTTELTSMRISKDNTLTTGSVALNNLLGGGLKPGAVYEIFGDCRVGKTQLAHQLCVNVQLTRSKGGLEGNALYIDTEGTFDPERISEMAYEVGLNPTEVLKNIVFGRAYNSDHQMALIDEAEPVIKEKNIKLIVVDSLLIHFASEYISDQIDANGEEMKFFPKSIENHFNVNFVLRRHLSALHRLAIDYNIIVYFTYYIESLTNFKLGDPFKPTKGTILAREHHTRIFLRKGEGDTRIAHLYHSPHNLQLAHVPFYIYESGIGDL